MKKHSLCQGMAHPWLKQSVAMLQSFPPRYTIRLSSSATPTFLVPLPFFPSCRSSRNPPRAQSCPSRAGTWPPEIPAMKAVVHRISETPKTRLSVARTRTWRKKISLVGPTRTENTAKNGSLTPGTRLSRLENGPESPTPPSDSSWSSSGSESCKYQPNYLPVGHADRLRINFAKEETKAQKQNLELTGGKGQFSDDRAFEVCLTVR